jgi:putative salt-induced outer membrane protein YdiY
MYLTRRFVTSSATLATLCLLGSSAWAQAPEVKQEFAKQEEVKQVVWKASASAGFSISTGNASVTTLSGGANISRNDGANKIAFAAKGLYGLTDLPVLTDLDGDKLVGSDAELGSERKTTAGLFLAALRYDRFFSKNNSGYIALNGGLDYPASKDFLGGGQIGYARQILNTKMHLLSGELGYDLNYTRFRAPDPIPATFQADLLLHSGRIFLGYVMSVADHTTIEANVEALINFNVAKIGDRDVDPGAASRINGQLAFTTKVWKALSLRAAASLRYNNAPGLTTAFPFKPDYPNRYNQKLDTLTELALVVNFI